MAIFKCKMCGAPLEIGADQTTVTCEYCFTKQTLPKKLESDRRANLYDRANHFRRSNEFDKAMSIYESILNDDVTDSEAYWSLVLCRYGIEYVEDPATKKRIPTVNRAQFTSIFDDDNYKSALQYADDAQKAIYQQEANTINEIQKGILAISQKEEPFDVFICYKETDQNGRRTQDSVLANDLYHQLTAEGFKVFFARITLEDKLGVAYEPYIFAALNSAKVMVVLGTKPEYFNAVWVKNEWSRYLTLVKQSAGKKILIPAYRDMDPYDLPEEFSHLQAQDMSKLGFMQDLIRGIKKLIQDKPAAPAAVKETVVVNNSAMPAVAPLLKRVFMFLEDRDWERADDFCEQVLNLDPENAEAYLGKLMAELKCSRKDMLQDQAESFASRNNYQKVIRFGSEELKAEMKSAIDFILERNETARKNKIYKNAQAELNANTEDSCKEAVKLFQSIPGWLNADEMLKKAREQGEIARKDNTYNRAKSEMCGNAESSFKRAAGIFKSIPGWKDADDMVNFCNEKAEEAHKNKIYDQGVGAMNAGTVRSYNAAITQFESIPGWRDADQKAAVCKENIAKIKADEAAKAAEAQRLREEWRRREEAQKRKRKAIFISAISCIIAIAVFVVLLITVIIPGNKYTKAIALMNEGKTVEAYEALDELDGYKDSAEKASSIYDEYIVEKLKAAEVGDYVFFGAYEQDNNTSNGKEAIEWLVLDKEDGKALVISKYALACKPYNTSYTDVTWETCSLRKWLNGTFLSTAFSENEKEMIPTVTVSADKNLEYSTNPGNATQDKVFLLSITEAYKYFSSDGARSCEATAYAEAQGAGGNISGFCWWWLRSPGDNQDNAAEVIAIGFVSKNGTYVDNRDYAVRPAMWITIEP